MKNKRDKNNAELKSKFDEARGGEMPLGIQRMMELDPELFGIHYDLMNSAYDIPIIRKCSPSLGMSPLSILTYVGR